jgi:hypothetical protein
LNPRPSVPQTDALPAELRSPHQITNSLALRSLFAIACHVCNRRQFGDLTKVYERFGPKPQLAAKIAECCNAHVGYEDVLAICPTVADQQLSDADSNVPEGVSGFVYFMKSGRFYKIGRSNAAGRRESEIAIQLPEALRTLHTIRTDDPAGIEEYWHKRFSAKRRNGEWST